jgi:glycosyltransferase involved in cell wall biosynthesis
MKIYFVVLNEMLTGVIASQVIAPARAYSTALPELDVRVIFLEPARVAFRRRCRERLRELRGLWPGGKVGLCPYVGRLGKWAPSWALEAAVKFTGGGRARPVFHCRGGEAVTQAARVARRLRGRVIFDSRGASDHEAVLRLISNGDGGDPSLLLRAFDGGQRRDKLATEQADAVVAVTEHLAHKLKAMVDGRDKQVDVIPCCVERPLFCARSRARKREELGVHDDELLLGHVSTEARWESFKEVLDFFSVVRERRPARLLFLTTLPRDVVTASLAPDHPLREAIFVKRAVPCEVPAYLSAADVGLLLRQPHEAFKTCSPIKFAEYLGAGLVPVVSEGIGSTRDVVEGGKLGVVIPGGADHAELERCAARLLTLLDNGPDEARRRSIEACEKIYIWERYTPVISRLYGLA